MGMLNTIFKNAKVIIRRYSPSSYGWKGDYPTWADAKKQCVGYDAGNILEKVKLTMIKVLNGHGAYERDSVLFENADYSYPLLSYLLFAHELQANRLNVVDFGGSLASSYMQHRTFLERLNNIKWNIIEQPNFVETGKELFKDSRVSFHYTVNESIEQAGKPDLILLSSTLQYMEDPYELLRILMMHNIRFLVIDLTPFNYADRDRITIQRVDPAIYNASYPCYFLSYEKLKKVLNEKYKLISEHLNDATIHLDGVPVRYQGLLMELK